MNEHILGVAITRFRPADNSAPDLKPEVEPEGVVDHLGLELCRNYYREAGLDVHQLDLLAR